jgi:predicted NBD/HSP70 family sugar kinase
MRARDEACVGIDLSGSNVRAAVVDAAGHILGQERHRLLSKEPPQVAEAVVRAAKTACGAAGLPFGEVRALGVGVAGQVEKDSGSIASAPGLGWKDVPLQKLLQARASKLPMTLACDLAAAAWAERVAGAGKGTDDLLVVLVGSTVGAGMVVSGKLHEGATGAAGDLAHVKVHPNGRICACGQRGCLDAYASAPSLAAWARDDLRIAAAAACWITPAAIRSGSRRRRWRRRRTRATSCRAGSSTRPRGFWGRQWRTWRSRSTRSACCWAAVCSPDRRGCAAPSSRRSSRTCPKRRAPRCRSARRRWRRTPQSSARR